MNEPLIKVEDHGKVRRLVLNHAGSFNALSEAMLAALEREIAALAQSAGVRAVVLAATGKAFCAGHDLREMQSYRHQPDQGRAALTALFTRCAKVMQSLTALPQPVIAEVQGIATAAGCQLVAACDLAVAAEGARFGVNGINIGLFCSTPAVALSRKVAPGIAFELLATGEFIPAARAREIGLVNRVVPPETLTEATLALAQSLAAKLGPAMALGKAGFQDQLGLDPAEAYRRMTEVMVQNLCLAETDEGINAFLEKRPPNWS